MGSLYGESRPIIGPAWVTGRETPDQQLRRLRDINDAIEAQDKRDEERKNRELFKRLEHQAELKFSPPSPPRGPDTPVPFPDDVPVTRLGTQDRFESFLDQRLEGYEATFGMSPLFGSQAYGSTENMAREDWREEQSHVPDDLVAEREVGLYVRSRGLREGVERPVLDVDSKFDIQRDSTVADVAARYMEGGVPTKGGAFSVSEPEALRYASDAIAEWLKELEGDLRELLPKDVSDQTVREQLYRTMRTQEILSDVLDEMGVPEDERENLPQAAIDEALQRELEESSTIFGRPEELVAFAEPEGPGPLEALAGIVPEPLGAIIGGLSVPGDPVLQLVEKTFNKHFIPVLSRPVLTGPAAARPGAGKPEVVMLSLDDVHRVSQFYADPVTQAMQFTAAQPVRVGELGFGEVTGVETTAVSGALQSQLAEDIISEAISPDIIAIVLATGGVGIGLKGLSGFPKLLRITANLTVGTDVGLARGFPLLRASSARAVMRGLTAVARSPLALRNLPTVVRNNPVFQRGLYNLRAIRAERVGRGLPHDEWLKAIGATDDAKFRRVIDDAATRRLSATDDLPLRLAIDREVTTVGGRSAEEIIEYGLSPRVERAVRPRVGESPIAAFWRGEEGGGRFLTQREVLSEQRIFNDLNRGIIPPHKELLKVVSDADIIDPNLLPLITSGEAFKLLQARRLNTALSGRVLSKLKKAELLDLIDEAALPITKDVSVAKMRGDIKEARNLLKSVREEIKTRFYSNLTPGDMAALYLRRAEDAGEIPTQLVKDKNLDAAKWTAFDTKVSAAERQASMERYVSIVEKKATQFPDTPAGQVARASYTRDAKLFRWDWDVIFGNRPQAAVQEEVGGNVVLLASKHYGTPAERLASLAPERSKFITEGVDDFLYPWREVLKKSDLEHFRERLTTMMLDIEDGIEILDAGRQVETLFRIAKVGQGAKNRAYEALKVLTTHGDTPSPSQIEAMREVIEPVLGAGTTRALLNARKLTVKGRELVINTIGLPRALMASADISALGRQGSMLGARYPAQWAQMAARSIRAFWSPGYADSVRDSLVHSGVMRLADGQTVDVYDFYRMVGGFLGSDAGQKGLIFREETWMTSFASKWGWHLPRDAAGHLSFNPKAWEKIPFPVPLAQSERSYILPLDKMRMDFFKNTTRNLLKRGMGRGTPPTIKDFEQLALFINNASGRGNLYEWLTKWHPLLNAMFFAPRLVVSRFAVTGDLIRHTVKGGPMRRVVWETLAADAATAGGALFMLNLGLGAAGIGEVGFNPLKKSKEGKWYPDSDFLKIKIGGETRIDFLASMLPIERLMLGLGIAATRGDGEMAAELAYRFVRTKESPGFSGITDVVTGTDFAGGKIEMTLDDLLGDVVASRVIPLSWQSPFEAISASRGEIDVDIGPAVMDVVSDYKLDPHEALVAGVSLSAEIIGGGVVSYFRPGDKLRELDDENLQRLMTRGELKENEGQEINDMDDLDLIQTAQVEAERGSEEKELEAKVLEQGLWRDSEWAKNVEEEEKFQDSIRLKGGYFHPETGVWDQTLKWPQDEVDRALRTHQIDGGEWSYRTGENTAAVINARNALFSHEEEDIEDIENPVDKLIAEYWDIEPIDHMTMGGEYDWDAFKEEREAKKAQIAKAVGDPVAVAEYFESFREDDTQTQKDARVVKEQRDTLLDETPMYGAGVSEVAVNKLQANAEAYLLSVGSSWSVARYLQWLYYQGEEYQTNEIATAYWVALGERDMVINPERTRIVLANEDLVLFYPGLFRGLTDEGKQSFVNMYDIKSLSKELKEDFIDTGEISRPGARMETELFQPQPLFQR